MMAAIDACPREDIPANLVLPVIELEVAIKAADVAGFGDPETNFSMDDPPSQFAEDEMPF